MPSSVPPADSSPDASNLSLEQLSALAGLTARTVRYYIAEGLVSRPEGAKRGAYYTRQHLDQLLLIRRWTDAGLSLERVRALSAGAPEDAPPQVQRPGTVEVWSRIALSDGVELHLEPSRAGLTPEQVRELVHQVTEAWRRVRAGPPQGPA